MKQSGVHKDVLCRNRQAGQGILLGRLDIYRVNKMGAELK